MDRRRVVAVAVALGVAATAVALILASRGPDRVVSLPDLPLLATAAPTPSPTPALIDLGFQCSVDRFETCRGSVRIVGSGISAVDVWVDSLDAAGKPFFSCRAQVANDSAAGATLQWRTVCEPQTGTASHRVRFTDRAASPIPSASPGS